MAHPRLPQARFRRQAHWDLASGGRWRASVKLAQRGYLDVLKRRVPLYRLSDLGRETLQL
jgi:hypothetical protein